MTVLSCSRVGDSAVGAACNTHIDAFQHASSYYSVYVQIANGLDAAREKDGVLYLAASKILNGEARMIPVTLEQKALGMLSLLNVQESRQRWSLTRSCGGTALTVGTR